MGSAKETETGEPRAWEGKHGVSGSRGGAGAPHVIYLSVVLKVVMRCSNMEVTSDLDKSESSSR